MFSFLVHLGLHINFSNLTFASLRLFLFLGVMLGYCPYVVSLLPDKLTDIQQFAFSLLQSKANFCANDHSQLQRLCHVIQSGMLTVYHSHAHLFSPVHFSFSALCQLEQLSHLQQSPVPLQFPFPDVVIATNAMPTHWAFYFQGSGLPLSVTGSYCLVGALNHHHEAVQNGFLLIW